MSQIIIKVIPGNYENENVYENVLLYIANKTYIGGYGFSCNNSLSIASQFRLSETNSEKISSQKIWHFVITFSECWKHIELIQLATYVASIFAPQYQVFYGVDLIGHSPHLHFAVNAFSYHPESPVLSKDLLYNSMTHIHRTVCKLYPFKSVALHL